MNFSHWGGYQICGECETAETTFALRLVTSPLMIYYLIFPSSTMVCLAFEISFTVNTIFTFPWSSASSKSDVPSNDFDSFSLACLVEFNTLSLKKLHCSSSHNLFAFSLPIFSSIRGYVTDYMMDEQRSGGRVRK